MLTVGTTVLPNLALPDTVEDAKIDAAIILVLVVDLHVCGGSCLLAGRSIVVSLSLELPG